VPRRQGHPRRNKPWDRENYKSRRRRKRVGNIKERAKRRGEVKHG
jgi:hypothetical protein